MKFVTDYFNAEKYESLFFIGVGVVAILAGLYLWFGLKEPLYKGCAWPLIAVALIQITVGITVYFRSPKDIIMVEHIIQNEPTKIQSQELPRMEVVMKNFVIYRYVEIVLLLVGVLLLFTTKSFWQGVGIGLFIQASLMLSLDYFAEKRGKEYITTLREMKGR